jgi:3-hydroxyacyl-CoA dehydrogenase
MKRRLPVGDDQRRNGDVGRDRDDPVEPVVPTQREAERWVHEACSIGAEGARYRHVGGQFAERGHEEIDHEADGGVGEQGAAGTGFVDGGAAGHEQAGADAAADGDHRQMARLELALHGRVGLGGGVGHGKTARCRVHGAGGKKS